MASFALSLLPDHLAVVRLPAGADPLPAWARGEGFFALVRTADETSLVCAAAGLPEPLPEPAQAAAGWRALRVQGQLEFSMLGVLASLAAPLAEAGVSIFVVSTYDTDYLLVQEPALPAALAALQAAGHIILNPETL